MITLISHDDLISSDRLIDDLARTFDFDLHCASDDTAWITLDPPVPFAVIASEGAGGVFLAYGEGDTKLLPILYATSEGQAGRVASNLTEFLSILLDVPYWNDLLKFSNKGSLSEMRKTAEFMEREHSGNFPELPKVRERVMSALSIPKVSDPIKTLHDSVHATDCTMVAEDGYRYDGLFNSFKSSDNPNWA